MIGITRRVVPNASQPSRCGLWLRRRSRMRATLMPDRSTGLRGGDLEWRRGEVGLIDAIGGIEAETGCASRVVGT